LALFQWWGGTEIIDETTVQTGVNWLRIGIVAGVLPLDNSLKATF
jgi:hypothetical protein